MFYFRPWPTNKIDIILKTYNFSTLEFLNDQNIQILNYGKCDSAIIHEPKHNTETT